MCFVRARAARCVSTWLVAGSGCGMARSKRRDAGTSSSAAKWGRPRPSSSPCRMLQPIRRACDWRRCRGIAIGSSAASKMAKVNAASPTIKRRVGAPGIITSPWSIRRHTAQKQPFEVVVRYPYHPLAGKRIIVIRRVSFADLLHFVINDPNGCRTMLPAWMTESWAAALPLVKDPRLPIDAIRTLRRLIDPLRSSPSSAASRTSGGNNDVAETARSSDVGGEIKQTKVDDSRAVGRGSTSTRDSYRRVRRHRSAGKGANQ